MQLGFIPARLDDPKQACRPVLPLTLTPSVRLDWLEYHDAAKLVAAHHYLGTMPGGRLISIGVWEFGRLIGVIVYSNGANSQIGGVFEADRMEVCQLSRVAFAAHTVPVSQVLAASLRVLKRACPNLRGVLSYADPWHGHRGGIYQASNWVYMGISKPLYDLLIDGVPTHRRNASERWGTSSPAKLRELGVNATLGERTWKHTYAFPLDRRMARFLNRWRLPAPKTPFDADFIWRARTDPNWGMGRKEPRPNRGLGRAKKPS